MSICNEPNASQDLLRKSITFAYVHLRGNKSKRGLEEVWVIKLVKLYHCTATEPTSNVAHNSDLT